MNDWEGRLTDYLNSIVAEPFCWGSLDCCLFACNAVKIMTGIDLAASFRDRYKTRKQASRVMQEFAGGNVEQVAEKVAGQCSIPEVPVLTAQRGDVVLFDSSFGPALGIVGLDGCSALFMTLKGLQQLPVNQCRRAWSVRCLLYSHL